MTFKEIQDEVILDRFSTNIQGSRRTSVQRWVNTRYGRLWNQESWTFRRARTPLTLNAGSNSVTPSSLGQVWKIYDITTGFSTPIELNGIANDDFDNWSVTTAQNAGIPSYYTVLNGTIYFDRTASSQRSYRVINLVAFTPLSGDTDVPLIPVEHHMTLVIGASAEGLKIQNDPGFIQYEQEWSQAITDMKMNYLTETKIAMGNRPSWP